MEALERARAAYGTGAYDDATIEFLFPEVKDREDERIRKWIIDELKDSLHEIEAMYSGDYDNRDEQDKERQAYLNKALTYLEKQKEQNPAEWSEEDEKMWKKTQKHLEDYIREFDPYHSKQGRDVWACLSWLKSLRPQPKQEWSEEDEEKINNISEIIEHCITIPYSGGTLTLSKEYKKELQCFLKSLRPSWKPSEEQMRFLLAVINEPNNAGSESCHIVLNSLYHDLKNLK